MTHAIGRFYNRVTRIACAGVGAVIAYSFLEEYISPFFPLIPLVLTVLGSLIAGSLVRLIFVRLFNKKLNSNYRYTDTGRPHSRGQSGGNTASRQRTTASPPPRYADGSGSGTASPRNTGAPPDPLSIYRSLLGLGQHFTAEELKAAYREAAAMYHPDRYASAGRREREDAEDLMKKVNEAYERLKAAAVQGE